MELKVTGRLYAAFPAQQRSEKFTNRKFWLEIPTDINGSVYYNYAEFQLVNARCSLLDQFMQGQTITVSFNLKGSLWTDKQGQQRCINTLDAWKIELAQQPVQQGYQQQWGPQPQQQQPGMQQTPFGGYYPGPAQQQPMQAPAPQQYQQPTPQQAPAPQFAGMPPMPTYQPQDKLPF